MSPGQSEKAGLTPPGWPKNPVEPGFGIYAKNHAEWWGREVRKRSVRPFPRQFPWGIPLEYTLNFIHHSFSTGLFRPGSFWPFWAPFGPIRPLPRPWLGAQGLCASDGLDLRSIGGFQTPFRTDFRSGFLADFGMYRWSVV